jgi:hypothetical protein
MPNFARLGTWNVIMFLTLEQVRMCALGGGWGGRVGGWGEEGEGEGYDVLEAWDADQL